MPLRSSRLNPWRLLRAFVIIVAAFAFFFWIVTPALFTRAYLSPARNAINPDPSSLDFPVESVTWAGRDGVLLSAWFGRVSATAPIMLLGPGYGSTRASLSGEAGFLYHAGYSVLMMDFRGSGASGGDMITFGVREAGDVSAAIDYLLARPDIDNPPVGGLGVSMGAGIMIVSAAQDHRLKAIVGDSSYATVVPAIEQWNAVYLGIWPYRLPLAPIAGPFGNFLLDGQLYNIDPEKRVAEISPNAILLIHSAKDTNGLTLPEGVQRIYDAAKDPRELAILPEGSHGRVWNAQPAEYERRVLDFLAKYLR